MTPDQIRCIEFTGERLVDRDFSGELADSFVASKSRFLRCAFSKVQFDQACWGAGRSQSEYVDCNFDGARFSSTAPGNARFVRCSFLDVCIEEFIAFDVEFIDCVFSGQLSHGFINGTRDAKRGLLDSFRRPNEIRGNDFSRCDFQDFDFRTGVDLSLQKLPAGDRYAYLEHSASAISHGRRIVSSWDDGLLRAEGVNWLSVLQTNCDGGQRQYLLVAPRKVVSKSDHALALLVTSLRASASNATDISH